jgi:hypothetical protein
MEAMAWYFDLHPALILAWGVAAIWLSQWSIGDRPGGGR